MTNVTSKTRRSDALASHGKRPSTVLDRSDRISTSIRIDRALWKNFKAHCRSHHGGLSFSDCIESALMTFIVERAG